MNDKETYTEVPAPEWTVEFFWEDITFIFQRILDFIKSLFN